MDNFRRYAQAYLGKLRHPFDASQEVTFTPTDLNEAINFTTRLLLLPADEHRIANLNLLFGAAFEQYLIVSRDQIGALINAVERLAMLLEPYLKKLTYLCYPKRTFGPENSPLWHCGMEQISREIALASANLKKTEDSYWIQQPLEDERFGLQSSGGLSRRNDAFEATGCGLWP